MQKNLRQAFSALWWCGAGLNRRHKDFQSLLLAAKPMGIRRYFTIQYKLRSFPHPDSAPQNLREELHLSYFNNNLFPYQFMYVR